MNTPAPILEVSNIEVVYNKAVQVLRGLSLAVPRGQIVALLGSNGAGKSTTLKAVSNLLDLQNGALVGGEIRFDGQDTRRLAPHALVRGGLFHVLEGAARVRGPDGRGEPRCRDLCADRAQGDGVALRRRLRLLSAPARTPQGTGRAISRAVSSRCWPSARALVAEPQLMLLDEPSLGLSPVLVETIFEIIARINAERGTSMLLVEQNASVALAVAHYGYIMENGKVVIDNTAPKLAADPDVREFYLGVGHEGGAKSFRDLKHYKRRKRWLS